MKREIIFRPAFDKRSSDPKKNYGIHGVEMAWYLTGAAGVIQFVVYTAWHLPHVQAELDAKPIESRFPHLLHKPMPADIGYHSYIPRYEGQTLMTEECPLLDGAPCYYDGSGLNAEKGFVILCEKGSEGVWLWMEEWYQDKLVAEPENS